MSTETVKTSLERRQHVQKFGARRYRAKQKGEVSAERDPAGGSALQPVIYASETRRYGRSGPDREGEN